jgi:hypothetical protein
MPHSKQKHVGIRHKRVQIVDEDGWTRVLSARPSLAKTETTSTTSPHQTSQAFQQAHSGPAVLHLGATVEPHLSETRALAQYNAIEAKWKISKSCKALEKILCEQVLRHPVPNIDVAVLFGSGSLTGIMNGWIDRGHVAMYQVAAFRSVVDTIGKLRSPVLRRLEHADKVDSG